MVNGASALAARAVRLDRAPAGWRARSRRIALYSHDTVGLGHRRRSLLIAQTLSEARPAPVTLTVSGASDMGGAMAMPPGVDTVFLPALSKVDGEYRGRRLDLPLDHIVAIRSRTILAALESFDPELLIVDNVPRGAEGELDLALTMLRAKGRTRCVLGLRDVLDEPDVVRRQWRKGAYEEAIRRHYDAVWIYGDPAVYDLKHEYGFPADIARKVQFTGYLDPRARRQPEGEDARIARDLSTIPAGHRLVVCLVGGGEDGGELAQTFVRTPLPPRTCGVMVMGPFMPEAARARVRAGSMGRRDLRVVEAMGEPTPLIARADRVIMMGGYNTTCEVLALERRALIVPRVTPRREQIIRARRLEQLGLVHVLSPDELTTDALAGWLGRDVAAPRVHDVVDMGGLNRVCALVDRILPAPALTRIQGGRA